LLNELGAGSQHLSSELPLHAACCTLHLPSLARLPKPDRQQKIDDKMLAKHCISVGLMVSRPNKHHSIGQSTLPLSIKLEAPRGIK
jgi:hypothetical protein